MPTDDKPDALRALLSDPVMRELVDQHNAAKSPEERERILEIIAATNRSLHPEWHDTLDEALRNGTDVRSMFLYCLKEARKQADLSKFERDEIEDTQIEFKAIVDTLAEAPPDVAANAYRWMRVVQKMMMFAAWGPAETQKVRAQALRDQARRGGLAPKANKAWVPYALALAHQIIETSPNLSDNALAGEIVRLWEGPEKCPTQRWLAECISGWRDNELRPPRRPS